MNTNRHEWLNPLPWVCPSGFCQSAASLNLWFYDSHERLGLEFPELLTSSATFFKMNKTDVIQAIIQELEAQLATATAASKQAAETATDEESKAETKWDTQGLEASYLAAGQAEQARVIGEALQTMKRFLDNLQAESEVITAGTLVKCDLNGATDWFFVSPVGGGLTVEIEDIMVTVLTPQSPLGSKILRKNVGTVFTLPNGAAGKVLSVQ